RLEHSMGDGIGPLVEHSALSQSSLGEDRTPHTRIAGAGPDRHQPLPLEQSQKPADVSRIETEPAAQLAHVGAVGADFPEEPRLTERPGSSEEMILECADAFGDDPVEAPDLVNVRVCHDV